LVYFLGVDTWLKLHTQMLASIFRFLKTLITCKQKFNTIYKQYKDNKIVNKIASSDLHKCPFYDALDSWWHQNGNVMKHVSTYANETKEIISNPES
jgi:hypothetical protein